LSIGKGQADVKPVEFAVHAEGVSFRGVRFRALCADQPLGAKQGKALGRLFFAVDGFTHF